MVGQIISHYKILAKLGEGGMGEVYLAEDTELDRKVALKFLPSHLTADADIKTRFKREAKSAAALNHPNIITVYEVGEYQGRAYIAMEYVEGQALKDLIAKKTFAISQVIDIARQICEGLNIAHQAGITHRDIKPANILVANDGRVKILDFGLAKLKGVTQLTNKDATLGTLHYMSPEQYQSAEVDHRTDIWSLGVVLYEMITGQFPFQGEYQAAVFYAVMNVTPEPLARYKAEISEDLQRIVDKALDKDLATRYQHIDDLLADLKREGKSSSTPSQPIITRRRDKRQNAPLKLAAFAIVLVFIIILSLYLFNRRPAKHSLATHKQITFTGNAFFPAIAPDGKSIAYTANQRLMVQDLTSGQSLEVFSGMKESLSLRWSPDGSELILSTVVDDFTGTYFVPRFGGSFRRIWTSVIVCWSPDGSQIASTYLPNKRIWFTKKATGDTTSILLSGDFTWLNNIDWSPLDKRLLFLTQDQKHFTIWTIKVDGSQQQPVLQDSLSLVSPRWSANGDAIYYLRSNGQTKDLMKIKIVTATGKAEAPAHVLQSGLQAGDFFTLSKDNKRLLYTCELSYSNLWLASLEDKDKTPTVKTKALTTGTSLVEWPGISPDGKKVAFNIGANIFVMPIEGDQMQQLTFLDSCNAGVAWSPDGKEIAFGSTQDGNPKVWRIDANGGAPRPFANSEICPNAYFLT